MKRISSESGFTLMELVITTAVVGILATLAVSQYYRMKTKSQRSEAQTAMMSVFAAQHVYRANELTFASDFRSLGFPIVDAEPVTDTKVAGDTYVYDISQPAGFQSWRITASGNIDSDEWPDVLVMYERYE